MSVIKKWRRSSVQLPEKYMSILPNCFSNMVTPGGIIVMATISCGSCGSCGGGGGVGWMCADVPIVEFWGSG